MKASVHVLVVVLAVLLAGAVGCTHENGRRGWAPSRPQTMTCEVTVDEKLPKRGKADKSTPKPRKRLGPEIEPADRDEASRLRVELLAAAKASGELIVDLPAHVTDMGDGKSITIPWRQTHPLVDRLESLAREFIEHARQYTNDEAAAVGHILVAVHQAIERNDIDALNEAEKGPHTWARKYIRPGEGHVHGAYLPLEDTRGRLLSGGLESIVGGFRLLSSTLQTALEVMRADCLPPLGPDGPSANEFVLEAVAESMAANFPGIRSLNVERDHRKRIKDIMNRIRVPLRAQDERRKAEPVETAAADIAQELLEAELRLSGKSKEDIRRAFRFREP
jgi:hypothetical protein